MWHSNVGCTCPAYYDLILGQQLKGYCRYSLYTIDTCIEHSRVLRKMVYMGGRHYLEAGPLQRRARVAFDGDGENRAAPLRTTAEEIYNMGTERQQFLDAGGVEDRLDDPVQNHGVKQVNILYKLEYWMISYKNNVSCTC
jgi:hypothetical protein